ncbi:UDP-glucose 6-dehydrogenase [Moraxella marmotae]|uniref:UDP-glucose 6-dehydrogenase n=1 Tax=Moraxella marmotae TaxID=3344520 RepID=UPI00366B92C4
MTHRPMRYWQKFSGGSMHIHQHIYVMGHHHEALNACLWLASLGKQVHLWAKPADIQQTLEHYQFDTQMAMLWSLYCSENKIILADGELQPFLQHSRGRLLWLFLEDIGETIGEIKKFLHQNANPHSQIILSGTGHIGTMAAIAEQIKSAWVYYLPISFMKDGANFNAFYRANLLMIGEKSTGSVQMCDVLMLLKGNAAQCEITDIKTVEFARSSMIAMLATRLSFMNEMARLADKQSVNIKAVERIMGKDHRIGSAYLSAGWGFGGKTLPKELALLSDDFAANRVQTTLISATSAINEDQKELIFRKFWRYFDGFIEQKTVVIWGTGYRRGASRTTNSAIHPLLKLLWSYGIATRVYTHHTAFEIQSLYGDEPLLTLVDDAYTPLMDADALFIVNWSLLVPPDIHKLNQINLPIFDAKNVLDDDSIAQLSAPYFGIGYHRE